MLLSSTSGAKRDGLRGVAMARQGDPPGKSPELPLAAFELPKWLVEPAVRSCRMFNTALDFVFYDVPTLRAALAEKDAPDAGPGREAAVTYHRFRCTQRPRGLIAPD